MFRTICAAAALVCVLVATTTARAFNVETTLAGQDVHWITPRVELVIDPSFDAVTYASTDAVHDSAAAWNGTGAAATFAVARGDGSDTIGAIGHNAVFFAPNGYTPAGGALAVTALRFDESTGTILDADIVVNGAYRFKVLDPNARSDGAPSVANDVATSTIATTALADAVFDLPHVLAHEMGHVLGLRDDTASARVLMYQYTSPNDASQRAPTADDAAGVRAIYGGAAHGQGCGARIAPHRPAAGATSGIAIALAGVLFFLLARRRPAARAAIVAGAALVLVGRAPTNARGDDQAPLGHARARVTRTSLDETGPLLVTRVGLAVETCRIARCPTPRDLVVWGGTKDGVTLIVGHARAPSAGDAVEIAWDLSGDVRPALGPAFFAAR